MGREVDKDPRLVELILSETKRIVRSGPDVLIVQHRLGFVSANAGVDQSNVGPQDGIERALLLPRDPDASAERLRAAQFVDVIQWTDDSPDTMVWRFERQGNEIKYGAKLTVREGQTAVFVNEGEIADTFTPGMYELFTRNLPILSTLQAWPHGFESPFKAEVYFCSSRVFTDLKWGTKNPVIARDAEFGAVRLRA